MAQWWQHDDKIISKAYATFGTLWWLWFGAQIIIHTPKHKPSAYIFTCKKLHIYSRNGFTQKILKIIKKFDLNKFEELSLVDIGRTAILELNNKCKFDNLIYEQKILYYIIGIEVYDYMKDLKYGNELIGNTNLVNWEKDILPQKLKEYRNFLQLSEIDIPNIEKAYDQLITKGVYP